MLDYRGFLNENARTMPNYTLFIADLHLSPQAPQSLARFNALLDGPARSADALYILGDCFDAWLGDDDNAPLWQTIKKKLHQLTKAGTPTYFIRGNHDFLISRRFTRETGVVRLNDPHVMICYGRKTILTHGDKLCTQDKAYQRYRRVAFPLFRLIHRLVPLKLRRHIKKILEEKSHRYTSTTPRAIQDVTASAVDALLEKQGGSLLIHGHTHRPAVHTLAQGLRIVLGDWGHQAEVLRLNADGSYELCPLDQCLARVSPSHP